jgi:hypothetical protein
VSIFIFRRLVFPGPEIDGILPWNEAVVFGGLITEIGLFQPTTLRLFVHWQNGKWQ